MESLQVRTGQISLQIIGDDGEVRGIFRFNPEDIESAKRVVSMQAELDAKQAELTRRAETAESIEEQVNLLTEAVDYFRGLVDQCFGEGTSDLVFGNAKSLSMFFDFFEGITPYYEKASKERMAKYTNKLKG